MEECIIQAISELSTDSKYRLVTHLGLPRSYSGVVHQAILRYLTSVAIAWHFDLVSCDSRGLTTMEYPALIAGLVPVHDDRPPELRSDTTLIVHYLFCQ